MDVYQECQCPKDDWKSLATLDSKSPKFLHKLKSYPALESSEPGSRTMLFRSQVSASQDTHSGRCHLPETSCRRNAVPLLACQPYGNALRACIGAGVEKCPRLNRKRIGSNIGAYFTNITKRFKLRGSLEEVAHPTLCVGNAAERHKSEENLFLGNVDAMCYSSGSNSLGQPYPT